MSNSSWLDEPNTTICLYGETGSGKTPQIGVLAEALFTRRGLRTRLYTAEKGGHKAVLPHRNAGILDVVALPADGNPWEWEKAARGWILKDGQWILDEAANEGIGLRAYEGMPAYAQAMMEDLRAKAASGQNIGGGSAIMFDAGFKDGQRAVKIGSNNQAHYGVVQGRLLQLIDLSFRLPGLVLWTAHEARGETEADRQPVVGPLAIGKALTDSLPSKFHYTFRLAVTPADPAMRTAKEHRLYLQPHKDLMSPRALANARQPLDADPLPEYIAPANIVTALDLFDGGVEQATARLRARLGLAA